jgi:hypothetical protein
MTLWKFLLVALTTISMSAKAEPIRVAVLDNIRSEKLSSERYVKDYSTGLELGLAYAKKKGIEFFVREFLFDKKPVEILGKISEVETWKPDIIIGPRSSDLMLLLRGSFKNVLVVSPLATSAAIATMPDNFYSISPPNSDAVGVFVDFVKRKFPGRAVFQFVQVDCSNCQDFADQFSKAAATRNVVIRNPEPSTYLSTAADSFDLSTELRTYQRGDVILLPNNSYSSGVVMGRLAEHLKLNDLVFLGGDGWGDWTVGYAGKFKSSFSYEGFRVVPWSIKKQDHPTTEFIKEHKIHLSEEPRSNISLIMYQLARTLTDAAISARDSTKEAPNRASILSAFLKMKNKDPNFARPKNYAILKISQTGEDYVGLQKSSKSKKGTTP